MNKPILFGKSRFRSLLTAAFMLSVTAINSQTTVTFNYTGSVQTFTVPPCVTSLNVTANGAQGGGTGGLGGRVVCTLPVTPGDVLNIYVGGQGGPQISNSPGGFNGGGNAGTCTSVYPGAGGGGATDIRIGGNTLSDRVVVAGGGGGSHQINSPNNAGAGGGLTGGSVVGNGNTCMATWATGGTQTAGGNPSTWSGTCCNFTPVPGGSFGQGGNGAGPASACNGGDGGAGGGGGWYGGGGGGTYTAGGGGSSYTSPSCTNVVHTQGIQSGNGSLTITYTASGGAPAAPASIIGSSSVCIGSTVTYTIASVSGATTYTWTVPTGSTIVSGQGTTSITMTAGSTAGNISVTAGNSCGTSAATTLPITINPQPTITATAASSTICIGQMAVLGASGGTSYVWSTGGTNPTETVSPSSTTTYTVTGTNANGCTNTATVTVTVNPLPVISATAGTNTICAGDTTTVNAQGGVSYVWSFGGTNFQEFVAPQVSTTYTVTGTDANGCSNTATVSINVNPLPNVTATASSYTVCSGLPVTMTASGASSYVWSSGGNNAIETVMPVATSTYTVTGTDANGCSASASLLINVNTAPVVNLGGDTTICGGPLVLDALNPGATYSWSTGATTQTITVTSSGNYLVTVTAANGCSNSDAIAVTINNLPNVTASASSTLACLDDANITLTGTPNGGTWSGPGVSGNTLDPSSAGTGSISAIYTYTDQNGCTNTAIAVVLINACVGIDENTAAASVVVYPNPSNGNITVTSTSDIGTFALVITDVHGRVVYTSNELNFTTGTSKQINLNSCAAGMYMMKISADGKESVQKISIQK